jgi:flagellar motor protein MotB
MKKLLLSPILLVAFWANSQSTSVERIAENAKFKTENKVNQKVDKAIDDVLDGNIFKKKKKKQAETESEEPAKAGRPGGTGKPTDDNTMGSGDATAAGDQQAPTGIKAYSKFDFVPGEKVLYYDDFERVDIGDFPADYNTNASGEVMTVEGKNGKWLAMSKNGTFIPEKMGSLPDNFTLEMNVGILENPSNNQSGFGLHFNTDKTQLFDYYFSNGSFVTLHPANGSASFKVVDAASGNNLSNELKMLGWGLEGNQQFARLSIWRQGSRLRLYVNENKLMDIPRFFNQQKPYHLAFFRDFFYDCNLLITDIRLAVGAPDTRSKLITEGRFSTTGILFDFQQSTIKPESYQVLKGIAATLAENPTVRVKIVGHTSNDGDANANLVLSKQRAAAVKNALVKDFGIDGSRLETDGKGGAEPVDRGTTPEAKANNRRVEFIKL